MSKRSSTSRSSTSRSSKSVARILRHSADIAVSAPMIASKRMARLSVQKPGLAAASLGSMGVEKFAAFGSAWMGMTTAVAQAQMQWLTSMMFGGFGKPASAVGGKHAFDVGLAILARGIGPIHAQVKRNAGSKK